MQKGNGTHAGGLMKITIIMGIVGIVFIAIRFYIIVKCYREAKPAPDPAPEHDPESAVQGEDSTAGDGGNETHT